jgi:cytochrome c-type biogenesis protein CcmF
LAALGNATIILVLLLSSWATALAIVGGRRGSQRLVGAAELLVHSLAAITSVAMLVLIYGMLVSDYSMSYVHSHSERAMPMFYRVTAVWAGMEGSMLTWVWSLALVSSLAVAANRERLRVMLPQVIALLMSVVMFFGVLMLLHSNPFLPFLGATPMTGKGLNPLLQNPYMVTHPPTLYLGFVGLTVPFAFGFAALLTKQTDDAWIRAARPWALWAWYFLSLGLVLGMLWAYEELGWGGYWGWDPVENAALMPWLVATGFLHSIIVQERRQMFRGWSVVLALLAFVATIVGTFMTRSGFIDSVHAFARSSIGYVFLVYIALLLLAGTVLIVANWRLLKADNEIDGLLSRESVVLVNNWLLLAMTLLVLVLTILPNLSELFLGEKINISVKEFRRWVTPLGLLLLLFTAVGPLLAFRRTRTESLRRQLLWPALIGLVVAGGAGAIGGRDPQALLAWFLATLLCAAVVQELGRAALLRMRGGEVGFIGGLIDQIADNRRRYGGYIVHVGVALMCAGFAGDAFKHKQDVLLTPGQRVKVGDYELRYDGIRVTRDPQKTMVTASLTAYHDKKPVAVMQPARWFFATRPNEPTSEVSIRRSMREDLFIALGRYSEGGKHAGFMVVLNPLVNLVWIGFLVMTLGTLIAGIPVRKRKPRRASAEAKP